MHARRLALGLALFFVWAAPAHALDKKGADAAALKALAPTAIPGRVVVYGLPAALPPGSVVSQAAGGSTTAKGTKLGGKAWLYWADLAHGALFEHPSTELLIDDRTGRVLERKSYSWWPLVDHRRPAFLASDVQAARYAIYSSLPAPTASLRAAAAFVPFGSQLPRKQFETDCLFRIGDRTNGDLEQRAFGASLREVRAFADTAGIFNEGATTARELQLRIRAAIKVRKCKDVAIFLAGHGSSAASTELPTVSLGNGPTVTSRDLEIIMREHPTVTFKLMILSCYSGRFAVALKDEPNLAVISTSSSATEVSWAYIGSGHKGGPASTTGPEIQNTANDPGKLPPYTFGLLGALKGILASPTDMAATSGDLADIIALAAGREGGGDFTAQLGWTTPQLLASLAPKVSPISATFVQQEFDTHYDVLVTSPSGRRFTYRWTLHPPAVDPACNNDGHTMGDADEFVWHHGDQDGCDHTKEGPQGHLGTVDVLVSDGKWNCKASYFGTETGLGQPAGCTRA